MKNEVTQIKDSSRIKYIIKGTIFTYIFAVVLIFIYSTLLTYTNISDSTIPSFVAGISIISILFSSIIFSRQIGTSGIINGAIIGGIYIGLIYLLSSLFKTGFVLDKYSIFMIIVAILTGAIGGIIGVNFNRTAR